MDHSRKYDPQSNSADRHPQNDAGDQQLDTKKHQSQGGKWNAQRDATKMSPPDTESPMGRVRELFKTWADQPSLSLKQEKQIKIFCTIGIAYVLGRFFGQFPGVGAVALPEKNLIHSTEFPCATTSSSGQDFHGNPSYSDFSKSFADLDALTTAYPDLTTILDGEYPNWRSGLTISHSPDRTTIPHEKDTRTATANTERTAETSAEKETTRLSGPPETKTEPVTGATHTAPATEKVTVTETSAVNGTTPQSRPPEIITEPVTGATHTVTKTEGVTVPEIITEPVTGTNHTVTKTERVTATVTETTTATITDNPSCGGFFNGGTIIGVGIGTGGTLATLLAGYCVYLVIARIRSNRAL